MAIYRLEKEKDKLSPLTKTTFTDENITEKQIQSLIREQIETVFRGALLLFPKSSRVGRKVRGELTFYASTKRPISLWWN